MVPHGCADEVAGVIANLQSAGGKPTKFAESLLELLEVTAKIQQLDDLNTSARATDPNESDETRRWKDVSLMSANLCRGGLIEQQLGAIEKLQDIAARGGSLCVEAEAAPIANCPAQKGLHAGTGGGSPPDSGGSDGEAGTGGARRASPALPPGLSAPPGLAAPPGLSLPASAATPPSAPTGVRPPPGFGGPPGLASRKAPAGGRGTSGAGAQAKSAVNTPAKGITASPPGWAARAKGAEAFEPKAANCAGLNFDAYDD